MKIIIGLGNPGKKYEKTRHNVGFIILDKIIDKNEWRESTAGQLFYAKKEINGQEVEFIKPTTFMNNSGVATAYVYKKHPQAEIIVVHDDKDIVLGEIKVQKNRSAAGHNGVKSIIEHLGTQDFTRVRVGIAPKEKLTEDTADFVLDKFTKDEKIILDETIQKVIEEIYKII